MKTIMKTVIAALGAFMLLIITSTGAEAYRGVDSNTSWGRAYGKIWRVTGYSIGFNLTVADEAPDSRRTYVLVQGVRINNLDPHWVRLTPNTCGSGTKVLRSGPKTVSVGAWTVDGWRVKICRDIPNAQDDCGPASATAYRGSTVYG